MKPISIVFAGSFQDYSGIILQHLIESTQYTVIGVITTPPLTSKNSLDQLNPVHQLAEKHHIPVMTPSVADDEVITEIQQEFGQPDFLLTAGYGKLLPASWLSFPRFKALNVHFSLLPAYRGANPAEWMLIRGETLAGVSVIEMSPEFDTGAIISRSAVAIEPADTRQSLYAKLYQRGGEITIKTIAKYLEWLTADEPIDVVAEISQKPELDTFELHLPPVVQKTSPTPYASRFTRDDGFIAWEYVQEAMQSQVETKKHSISPGKIGRQLAQSWFSSNENELAITHAELCQQIERSARALYGFPSLWTTVSTTKGEKRLKIHSAKIIKNAHQISLQLQQVQLAGQQVAKWNQIKNAITAN